MILDRSFVRFCLVGAVNTLIDVPLFMTLRSLGASILLANICSTSVALCASFILNHKFTFRSRGNRKHKFMPFIAVTLVGLWVIQPVVIKLLILLNNHIYYTQPFFDMFGSAVNFNDLIPKLSSVVVTLVWNFVWYNKVIFAKVEKLDEKATPTEH